MHGMLTTIAHASVGNALATGLSLGVLHIITGPDHLGALAALSSGRSWREALKLGVQWGLGHSAGIAVVAVAALAVGHALNLSVLREVCNYLTGVSLLLLGVWTLLSGVTAYRAAADASPSIAVTASDWSKVQCQDASYIQLPADGSCRDPHLLELHYHDHDHDHGHGCSWDPKNWSCSSSAVASVCVGIVHGVAGPGELLGVLPVLAIHHVTPAITYLVGFSLSSALGMGVFAAVYGELTRCWALKSSVVALTVATISALLSIGVGAAWIALQATGKLNQAFGGEDSR